MIITHDDKCVKLETILEGEIVGFYFSPMGVMVLPDHSEVGYTFDNPSDVIALGRWLIEKGRKLKEINEKAESGETKCPEK